MGKICNCFKLVYFCLIKRLLSDPDLDRDLNQDTDLKHWFWSRFRIRPKVSDVQHWLSLKCISQKLGEFPLNSLFFVNPPSLTAMAAIKFLPWFEKFATMPRNVPSGLIRFFSFDLKKTIKYRIHKVQYKLQKPDNKPNAVLWAFET
jgi:hypothetical protein